MKQTKEQFVGITYDELLAENAKLRELLAGDETQRRIAAIGEGTVPTYHGTETVDEARLVVENAKLRELMRDALLYINRPCDGSCTHLRAKKELDGINERARELGIEVDG